MRANDFGRLIRGITANMNSYIGFKIEKYGIKQGQLEYFLLIYNAPGINQLEIGRLKQVGKASVTKAIKILEDDGFIKRVADENDRRNTLCYVTDKGENIVNDLLGVTINVEQDMFKDFTHEDKTILFNYLMKLHQNSEVLVNKTSAGER